MLLHEYLISVNTFLVSYLGKSCFQNLSIDFGNKIFSDVSFLNRSCKIENGKQITCFYFSLVPSTEILIRLPCHLKNRSNLTMHLFISYLYIYSNMWCNPLMLDLAWEKWIEDKHWLLDLGHVWYAVIDRVM